MLNEKGDVEERARDLLDLLASPFADSVIRCHTNDLGSHFSPLRIHQLVSKKSELELPTSWNIWWDWAGMVENGWQQLVQLCQNLQLSSTVEHDPIFPPSILQLLQRAYTTSLPRNLELSDYQRPSSASAKGHPFRMSQKKNHEVTLMASRVFHMLDKMRDELGIEVRHVVDIGSGQGYLSRALSERENMHILALDSSVDQLDGSERRATSSQKSSNITSRAFWLGDGPLFDQHPGNQGAAHTSQEALQIESVIDDWLQTTGAYEAVGWDPSGFVPVAFVALHACGSLSPDFLKKIVQLQDAKENERRWYVAGAVVVGCCYNLMQKSDFPMSTFVKSELARRPQFQVVNHHLHLASQTPSVWFRSKKSIEDAKISVKKVVYRAMIAPILNSLNADTIEEGRPPEHRIGKLNNRYYRDFKAFLGAASGKLGIDLSEGLDEDIERQIQNDSMDSTPETRRVEVLHALRCILGPACESLIVLDRYMWLKESLDKDYVEVELVNIFDQSISDRNIALVIEPKRL